jgi:hypothetical protein
MHPQSRVRALRHHLHEFPWLDDHHCHREAPPDQQDAGKSLKLDVDDAGRAGSADGPSITFGASITFGPSANFGPSMTLGRSTTFGLERGSEDSFGGRGEPMTILASPAPPGVRAALAGDLTSTSIRRATGAGRCVVGGNGNGGGATFFATIGR